jgi:hypothetical protein
VLVSGAGAAARNSIGLVLVSGMTVGTAFTLLVLPSLYMLIARDHARSAAEAGQAAHGDGCPLPNVHRLEVPARCRLRADEACRWSVDCDGKTVKVLPKAG